VQVANTSWGSHVKWTGGFTSKSQVRNFPDATSDEPAALGGTDSAPNPVEQLLSALGNCLVVGYAAASSAHGVKIESLDIDLKGDINLKTFLGLDPAGNAGYQGITVDVQLKSDATAEQLAAIHKVVINASPVGHTLSRPVLLNITLRKQ
jgi:uncharacterized OsmC-like protein